MDAITAIIFGILPLLFIIYFFIINKDANLPPGPSTLSISRLLSLGPLKFKSYVLFEKLMLKYGELFQVRIGFKRVVVLNSIESIREAYQTKGDNFEMRTSSRGFKKLIRNSGILFTDGPIWQEHRRFSLRILKDFGFGKSKSEDIIQSEMLYLLDIIDENIGKPLNSNDLLTRSISNVISIMTMGERPGYDDEEFQPLISGIKENFRQPLLLGPSIILDYFPFLLKFIPSFRQRIDNVEAIHKYIKQKIMNHKTILSNNSEPQDLIDIYLREQFRLNSCEETKGNHTFTDWQLIRVIQELFLAGTDTTSNTLTWLLLMMTQHPDIQDRVQREIDSQLGRGRLPTMRDRSEMPYVCAVIDETMRYGSIVPLTLHINHRQDTIRGFTIPQYTTTIANIYGIHRDPKLWKTPHTFNPEHFLNDQGSQYVPNDNLVPFSIGKRSCLGESLAKMETFLFFVGLTQRYRFALSKDDETRVDEILEGLQGLIRPPGLHEIVFTKIEC